MKVAEMLAALRADSGSEKVATAQEDQTAQAAASETNDEPNVKLAEDLYTAGTMFADGFIEQLLEKKAALGASTSHAKGTPLTGSWGGVAKKLQKLHSRSVSQSGAPIRAEALYPGVKRQVKS